MAQLIIKIFGLAIGTLVATELSVMLNTNRCGTALLGGIATGAAVEMVSLAWRVFFEPEAKR